MAQDPGTRGDIRLPLSILAELGVFVRVPGEDTHTPNALWREFGYRPGDYTDEAWIEAVHPEDREIARRFIQRVNNNETVRPSASYRVRDTAGNWRWIMARAVVAERNALGEPSLIAGIETEVTEFHRLQDELLAMNSATNAQALEAETLRTAGAVVAASLDKEQAVRQVIEQLSMMVPIDAGLVFEVVGRDLAPAVEETEGDTARADFFATGPGRRHLLRVIRQRSPETFSDAARPGIVWLAIPLRIRGQIAGVYVLERSGGRAFQGQEVRLAMAMADYLSLALNNARIHDEMRRLASRDQLSELLNRRALLEAGERELARLSEAHLPIACMILDIDHFKRVNDTYGHLVGDRAIRDVARRLEQMLRREDVVGRYGGEEFCAVLPEFDPEMCPVVAERVRAAVHDLTVDPIRESMSVSIGVVAAADAAEVESLEDLLQLADDALYRAKAEGRDRAIVVRFSR